MVRTGSGEVRAKDALGRFGEDIAARFAFPQWATGPRMVISSVEEWKRWALFELPLVEAMNAGPIALLGDAAHAMVPFLAQGAAMAIEDAWVVAKCLAATSDNVAEALRRYDAQRAGRVAHVQRAAVLLDDVDVRLLDQFIRADPP